jgi:hypothetical protein
MLLIWDCARMVRETVIFKENELSDDQWDTIGQIEYLVLEMAAKFNIPQG